MESVAVYAHIEDVDDIFDDLAEGQGDDGQIIAPEPQNGHAHDKAGDSGAHGAHQHGHRQTDGAGGDRLLEGEGDHNAGERAHAHKAGVAEAQLTGDAHYQIQGDGHGDIGADGHKLSLQRGG